MKHRDPNRPHLVTITESGIEIIRDQYETPELVRAYQFQAPDPRAGHPGTRLIVGSIKFQAGPLKNYGPNGLTETALLWTLLDRLEGHQAGPYASEHNENALNWVRAAISALYQRTADREARGVEGTNAL